MVMMWEMARDPKQDTSYRLQGRWTGSQRVYYFVNLGLLLQGISFFMSLLFICLFFTGCVVLFHLVPNCVVTLSKSLFFELIY